MNSYELQTAYGPSEEQYETAREVTGKQVVANNVAVEFEPDAVHPFMD